MKPTLIGLDVETHSHYNLKEGDAWLYSRHHTTGFNSIALTWCTKNACKAPSPGYLLLDYYDCLAKGEKLARAKKILDDPSVMIVSHDAPFEMYTLENVLGWKYPPEKFICTMAKAGYYHLPQSLDGLAKALGLPVLKDMGAGSKAMKELMHCDARGKHITPEDKPELFDTLYKYNLNDNVVALLANAALPDLPPDERRIWNMHYEINHRGIPIDWFLVETAKRIIATETSKLDTRTWMLTDMEVNSTRQPKELAAWFSKRVGRVAASVAKNNLDELEDRLPLEGFDDVRELIDIRRQVSLTSLAKFDAASRSMDQDNRIRDSFWYMGAHPGRWTGKGFQPQNLVNGFDATLCDALNMSDSGFIYAMYPQPLVALQGGVRGAVCATEGYTLLGVDLKQIEARAAAWIGGDQATLDLYEKGEDVYCSTASKLYRRPITKKDDPLERDTGKRVELLCQFGGGIGGLERTFRKNGVDIATLAAGVRPEAAEIDASSGGVNYYYGHFGELPHNEAVALDVLKQRWRKSHAEIVSKWDEIESGFLAGIYDDGRIKIDKTKKGSRVVTLASGRQMFYRNVQQSGGRISYEGRFGRGETYGASIFQNIVQGTDRDVICWYMLRVAEIAKIILHCHDEYILEILIKELADIQQKIDQLHGTVPPWSGGLPIGYEVWTDTRYSK